jgi:MerR family transcriptional regulator, thiopeptide resistance regulator
MYTIGQIGKRFSLSRSTLLYYDAIGLLSPSGRSEANYRLYTDGDVRRMEQIRTFRETGLPLAAIKTLLQPDRSSPSSILAQRLRKISEEIAQLRQQQHIIIKLLGPSQSLADSGIMTKARWVSTLMAAGLDEDGMSRWHAEFERSAPQAHRDFLASIGLDREEIELIREKSSAPGAAPSNC